MMMIVIIIIIIIMSKNTKCYEDGSNSVLLCCNVIEGPNKKLLSKNLKIKMYRNIISPVVLYGCETWSLTLLEKR